MKTKYINKKMECLNKQSAERFADRLKLHGVPVIKIAQHWGRWFVHFKSTEEKN